MMKHFESDYVKFGLHANPTSSVLIFDEFDGNQRAFRNEIRISQVWVPLKQLKVY